MTGSCRKKAYSIHWKGPCKVQSLCGDGNEEETPYPYRPTPVAHHVRHRNEPFQFIMSQRNWKLVCHIVRFQTLSQNGLLAGMELLTH
jgi:hypothetical protein